MRWVLLWFVLGILAAGFLTLIWLRFWRQLKSLKADAGAASHRMSEASAGRSNPPAR